MKNYKTANAYYNRQADYAKLAFQKDNIMPRYAALIYNGYWYSKERFKLQKVVDLKKNKVNGTIKFNGHYS